VSLRETLCTPTILMNLEVQVDVLVKVSFAIEYQLRILKIQVDVLVKVSFTIEYYTLEYYHSQNLILKR